MAGSGHASAFHRYTGVDDFVAVHSVKLLPARVEGTFSSGFHPVLIWGILCDGASLSVVDRLTLHPFPGGKQ